MQVFWIRFGACQVNNYFYIIWTCISAYLYYVSVIICLFLAQKYLYKNMYILNRFDTSCGTSIIPFHAI